ncbi:hypothetical protein AVEN_163618-1 [Araneus ventricosus]|uniref:Reverse transcriptase domain-containing protein n=1 Tax=Araneus ventricosus TaxID=182803 RepID=A0A4Y2RHI9_ARAVE|nr:hypothetical protein AVEN_163618-1 [Araneus ventricosus]
MESQFTLSDVTSEIKVPLRVNFTTRRVGSHGRRYVESADRRDVLCASKPTVLLQEDVPKTALSAPFGLFEFLSKPFGLSSAAATLEKFIHYVLRGMDFCVPYFDDALVASENERRNLEI